MPENSSGNNGGTINLFYRKSVGGFTETKAKSLISLIQKYKNLQNDL